MSGCEWTSFHPRTSHKVFCSSSDKMRPYVKCTYKLAQEPWVYLFLVIDLLLSCRPMCGKMLSVPTIGWKAIRRYTYFWLLLFHHNCLPMCGHRYMCRSQAIVVPIFGYGLTIAKFGIRQCAAIRTYIVPINVSKAIGVPIFGYCPVICQVWRPSMCGQYASIEYL